MKPLYSLLLLLTAAAWCYAVELPVKWDVNFCKLDEKTFLKGVTIGDKPQQITLSEKVVNLDDLANGCDSAALRCFISCDKAETVWLGIGSKVFSLSVNGKLIYDFRKYGLGNDTEDVSINDHKIPLELSAGRNELLINTRRTHWRLDFCYGKNRPVRWDLAVKILNDYKPVKAALAHPEVALRPDKESLFFSFVTTEKIPAGVDYRKKGDTRWLREYDTVGDLVLRENTFVHRVRINGIAGWGDIEYRLVLLEPPAGRDGFRKPLWASRVYKEVYTPVKTLRNPDRQEFSFLLLGDTQLSVSESCKTVEQRRNLMNKLKSFPEFEQADFLVHIGDVDSVFHSVEKVLLSDFLDIFTADNKQKVRPWVMVRGNHETNGIAAEKWFDHFQMPEDKSYYSFQLGEVFFIVLDCGDISNADDLDGYNGPLLDMEKLFRKQSQWLAQVRRSPEFRNARFRIVLSHTEPQIAGGKMNENIRKMTSELLADTSDSGRIHLWLAGHVHRYWRAAAGSNILTGRVTSPKPPALTTAPVNWVTVDGPKGKGATPDFSYLSVKCSPEKLHVTAIDENGKKIDQFEIDQKGVLKELYRSNELKNYPLNK